MFSIFKSLTPNIKTLPQTQEFETRLLEKHENEFSNTNETHVLAVATKILQKIETKQVNCATFSEIKKDARLIDQATDGSGNLLRKTSKKVSYIVSKINQSINALTPQIAKQFEDFLLTEINKLQKPLKIKVNFSPSELNDLRKEYGKLQKIYAYQVFTQTIPPNPRVEKKLSKLDEKIMEKENYDTTFDYYIEQLLSNPNLSPSEFQSIEIRAKKLSQRTLYKHQEAKLETLNKLINERKNSLTEREYNQGSISDHTIIEDYNANMTN